MPAGNLLLWLSGGLFAAMCLLWLLRIGALLLLLGRRTHRRRAAGRSWGPPVTEPVSVVVPAYNERQGIAAAVRSLAGADHLGGVEVVVVDDGSTDGTGDIVQALALPNVRLLRLPNGGKPRALNAGVAAARHDLIVMVDADTVFAPDAVGWLVQPFADPTVGAVAGNLKVGNRGRAVARWQHIEYVVGFNLERRFYDALECIPTVPGAIGAFRRAALADAGGMSADTLAEDTDLTMTLLRLGWRVVYEDRARAWTEVPATLPELFRQRLRWTYGTIQAMWKHRRSMGERGASGRFGRLCLPILAAFGVGVPLLSPVVDAFLLYALFMLDAAATAAVCLVMLGVQLLTALVAFRLDGERPGPLWELPLQQLVLRHLLLAVLVTSGVVALTGGRLRWRKPTRHGIDHPLTGRQSHAHDESLSLPPQEPETTRQHAVPAA